MGQDVVVMAAVKDPEIGIRQSVIYDVQDDALDIINEALPEDARFHQGHPVAWSKERTWELIQRAPAGEWGAADVAEVRDLTATPGGTGLLLFSGGQLLGELVNIAQREHFLALPPAELVRQLRHIGGGRGARMLHNGRGLIYRLIKDKPELRRGARSAMGTY